MMHRVIRLAIKASMTKFKLDFSYGTVAPTAKGVEKKKPAQ